VNHEQRTGRRKSPTREVRGQTFVRIPVRTHRIMPGEDIVAVALRYCQNILAPGDVLVVAQRPVCMSQGRLIERSAVKPRPLARFLADVLQSTYPIGKRNPRYIELALDVGGGIRVCVAVLAQLATAWTGRKRDFEAVAGPNVTALKVPRGNAVPPSDTCYLLPPLSPQMIVTEMAQRIGVQVLMVSADECGHVAILAHTPGVDSKTLGQLLLDNPHGQGRELTPFVIVRLITH